MSEQYERYELRARQLRILAELHRKRADDLERAAEMTLATRSMRRLADLLTEAETRQLAEHPDLAELNIQLESFYGEDRPDPSRPGDEPPA
ncbi:hypothetical protein AB0C59_25935 [Streptomyces sp. NPDC048664]|uniref:hypothetical protein n=1 Tax=Streptomyces sp. NPDC048664 TaxID=3154505 RepID=UPI003440A7B1